VDEAKGREAKRKREEEGGRELREKTEEGSVDEPLTPIRSI